MCRIYGCLGAGRSAGRLCAAAELMRAGGPDEQRCLTGDGWVLGANRLAIMDPQGGHQPFTLGRIHVAYSGEIYNHGDLRTRLSGYGYHFRTRCDGDVLPALYHKYGEAFTDHLDGMFAIAVLDLRAAPRLLLATDSSGMRPLYYSWDVVHRTLDFASELPALAALTADSGEVWLPGLDSYLTTRTPFGEQTMLAGINVLPRAATMVFSREKGLNIIRRSAGVMLTGHQDDHDRHQGPLEVLRAETHRLSQADAPVAVITSGGLDSGLVTALLAERVQPLHSFNIAYRGQWPMDERRYAQAVAHHCRTVHHQVELNPAELPDLLGDTVRHLGQPNADPITASTLVLFRGVQAAGFKVALTGDGADEHFCGYDRMRAAAVASAQGIDWVPGYLRALCAVPQALRDSLYTPAYRDYIREIGSEHNRLARLLRAPGWPPLQRITSFELDERLPAYHLRRVDHLSMAASVEARLPFCQPHLASLAASLRQEDKIGQRRGKIALYRAGRRLLPKVVLKRPKQPFTLPVSAMLIPGTPLFEHAKELLAGEELRADGQLDPDAASRLLATQAEHPSGTTALAVWSLLIYQRWRTGLGAKAQVCITAPTHGALF
jgi:asparagine synthase (glutamine-hydrolysing)